MGLDIIEPKIVKDLHNKTYTAYSEMRMSLEMHTFRMIKQFAKAFNELCTEQDTEEEQYNKMVAYFKEQGLEVEPYVDRMTDKVFNKFETINTHKEIVVGEKGMGEKTVLIPNIVWKDNKQYSISYVEMPESCVNVTEIIEDLIHNYEKKLRTKEKHTAEVVCGVLARAIYDKDIHNPTDTKEITEYVMRKLHIV